ncbi:hypothetical protein B0T24DRAFT_609109 [Lasiosphaeria ovina]|uniref:Uncharacterized protein n=1 Tax=Lasiosphaeria ovina TaxID=92902 RepID=A0AAE0NN60_9PEZI|nr:hypothetical protein B0T24DRAFT_609109 [Lasiosphaeria ovina]
MAAAGPSASAPLVVIPSPLVIHRIKRAVGHVNNCHIRKGFPGEVTVTQNIIYGATLATRRPLRQCAFLYDKDLIPLVVTIKYAFRATTTAAPAPATGTAAKGTPGSASATEVKGTPTAAKGTSNPPTSASAPTTEVKGTATAAKGTPAAAHAPATEVKGSTAAAAPPTEVKAGGTVAAPAPAPSHPGGSATEAAPHMYRLKCTQQVPAGQRAFEIISKPFSVDNATGAQMEKTVKDFEDVNGATKVPACPFRANGDFKWSLVNDDPAHTPVSNAGTETMPMDFFFMMGDNDVPGTTELRKFHFELIERAYPPYTLVAGAAWNTVKPRVVQNVVEKLWQLGSPRGGSQAMYYDSRIGVGGDRHHLNGANLDLRSFFGPGDNKMVNCFDLAAVLMMLLRSLGKMPDGTSVITNARCVWDYPWGYINEGPLFGQAGTHAHRCNNPFWADLDFNIHSQPLLPPNDAARTPFSCHCYVLFDLAPGEVHVVDACHALSDPTDHTEFPRPLLADGSQQVLAFRAANIDHTRPFEAHLTIAQTPSIVSGVIN